MPPKRHKCSGWLGYVCRVVTAMTLQRMDGKLALNMQKTVHYNDKHGALVFVLV